jgi:hypothetical protein
MKQQLEEETTLLYVLFGEVRIGPCIMFASYYLSYMQQQRGFCTVPGYCSIALNRNCVLHVHHEWNADLRWNVIHPQQQNAKRVKK